MDRTDLYWQRRLGEVERRLEKVEAQLAALQQNPMNIGDYYTIEQMAKALGIHRVTVSKKIKSGLINAQKVGKTWRIPKEELTKIFD